MLSRQSGPVEAMTACIHLDRELLNGYELVRKYECRRCGAILTCACDAEIARYILPHQASRFRDRSTGRSRRVSHPLTVGVCFECRSEPRPAYPRIAHRGAATAVHRYYWRELWRTTELRFLEWCRGQGLPLFDEPNGETFHAYRYQYAVEYAAIESQTLAEIREQHEDGPLYDTSEPSTAEVVEANHVTVRDIRACYVTPTVGRVLVIDEHATDIASAVGVEEFVAAQLRKQGREVIFSESRPFHALFSIMTWMWVQEGHSKVGRHSWMSRWVRSEGGSDPGRLSGVDAAAGIL